MENVIEREIRLESWCSKTMRSEQRTRGNKGNFMMKEKREREARDGEYKERQVPSCGPVNVVDPTSTAENWDI